MKYTSYRRILSPSTLVRTFTFASLAKFGTTTRTYVTTSTAKRLSKLTFFDNTLHISNIVFTPQVALNTVDRAFMLSPFARTLIQKMRVSANMAYHIFVSHTKMLVK